MAKTGRETSSVCEIKRTPRTFCSDRLEPTSRIAMGLKKMTLAWAARSPRSYLERGPSQRYSVLSSRQPSAGNLIAAIPLGVGQMPNEAARWSNRVRPEDASGFPRGGRGCRRRRDRTYPCTPRPGARSPPTIGTFAVEGWKAFGLRHRTICKECFRRDVRKASFNRTFLTRPERFEPPTFGSLDFRAGVALGSKRLYIREFGALRLDEIRPFWYLVWYPGSYGF